MESRSLARIVWEEGMHLAQHHFQAQSRFFSDTSTFALSSLYFGHYGFAGLEMDAEALLNGTVSLTHARGFLPDGLAFHFPHDPPPAPLNVRELFSPTQPAHTVHLAIPAYRPGAANTAPVDGPAADGTPDDYRFLLQREERVDEVTGEERKSVTLARKNFRLLLDAQLEETEGLVSLPVARVMRDGAGNFTYDANFIPPALRVGAVPTLRSLLDRMVEMLEARAQSIQRERQARNGGTPGPAEVGEMWLAHAVHQSLPTLRHMRASRGAHPEELYQELARLGGALCTFALDASPDDLPLYDHDDLGGCFQELERHLRSRLEVVLPTGSYRISVEPGERFFYKAQVADSDALHSAELYVGVKAAEPDAKVIDAASRLMKVCSAAHIARLVREAFPGLPLKHVPSPPAVLRPQPGFHYFHISKSGPCWASIQETSQVGIYAPAALPDPRLELVVVPAE